MNRRRWLEAVLIAGAGVVILVAALLWALPEILRRVAVELVPRRTGRALAIEDIDLNLFTGRLSARHVRLAERDGAHAVVELERIDARLAVTALLRSDIRLREVSLLAPSVRVARTGPGQFNVSDLLALAAERPPRPSARRWTVTVERLTISNGAVLARDEAITPAAEWRVRDLQADVRDLTTRPGAATGRGTAHARIDEATCDVGLASVRLDPLAARVAVALKGFELRRLGPYITRAETSYRLKGGRLGADLTAVVDHEGEALTKATLAGTVHIEDEALARTEQEDPFLVVSRADVTVKEADAITRSVTVSNAAIGSITLRARRDTAGTLDLAQVAPAKASARAPEPAIPVPRQLFPVLGALAHGVGQVVIERATVGPSSVTFVDEAVTPTTTLALTDMQVMVTDLTWPPKGPAPLVLSTRLPGGGMLHAQGSVRPQPFEADLTTTMRGAPVQPYQAYIPFEARLGGRFNGDSRSRVALKDGTMRVTSTGRGWAEGVDIRAPGATHSAIRIERVDLRGIDFAWPTRAHVAKVRLRRPTLEVVREGDGSFDVASLVTTPRRRRTGPGGDTSVPPSASPRFERPKNLLQTIGLRFGQIRIEDGSARFLDRTTSPAFSKDLSQLSATIEGLDNRPGGRARLALQSIVSGDSRLDLRGELASIGSPVFVDLVGDLAQMPLASFNPYTEDATGWVVKQGDLHYTLHLTLDGDALEATNEIVLGQLRVAPTGGTDLVRERLGLPLSFIVALAKDANGEIRGNVPVTGSIRDPTFHLRASIWAAVRQAIVNLVRSPFRTIGRLGRDRGDTLEPPTVDPVTFASGSAVIAPDMEEHLLRVADVLRRSPFVDLALTAVPGAADAEALGSQVLTARLRAFQEARGLPDGPGVIAAYFAERLPGVPPPPSVQEQLTLLRRREPVPRELLDDLGRRRLDAVRRQLVAIEGIPADRLETGGDAKPGATAPASDRPGRVDLVVVAGAE